MKKPYLKQLGTLVILGAIMMLWMTRGKVDDIYAVMRTMDQRWLALGALSLMSYLSLEAVAFQRLLYVLGEPRSFWHCLHYACADFFFSNVTPGGAGGQPGQYAAMTQDGLSAPVTLLALFAFNLIYHLILLGWVLGGVLTGMGSMLWRLTWLRVLLVVGVLAQGYFVVQFLLLLFWPKASRFLLETALRGGRRWRGLAFIAKREESLREKHALYEQLSGDLKKHWARLVLPCLWIVPMLAASYSIGFAVYCSLGGGELSWGRFILLQGLATVATESLPLPAGVGAVESSHGLLYQALLGVEKGLVLVGCTRLLWCYGGLLFAGVGMILFQYLRGKCGSKVNRLFI